MYNNFSQIDNLLEAIIKDSQKHARWLNTLSFLEYMGLYKMLANQDYFEVSEDFLKHINEISKHNVFLKNLIHKTSSLTLPNYMPQNLFCGFSAYRYFQSLDIVVQQQIATDENFFLSCYLYVSHLVEKRSIWLYKKYNGILQKNNSAFTLNSLINEKENQLVQIEKFLVEFDPDYIERIDYLSDAESYFFERFYFQIEKNI